MPVEKVNFFDTIYPASRGSTFLAPLAAHLPGEAMKLSRNALKNLSKRYKAILKKCCLLNGLGMLLVAGSCVLGVDGLVFAEQSNDNNKVYNNTTFNDTEVHGGKGGDSWDNYSDVNSNNNSLALQNCIGTIGSIFG